MKIKLNRKTERGYYIDPITCEVHEIEKEVPDGAFVMLKEREDSPSQVMSVKTSFHIAQGKKLQRTSSKIIGEQMSKACATYILENEELPLEILVKEEPIPNQPVILVLYLEEYLTIDITISEEDLNGEDPFEIITSIINTQTIRPTLYDRDSSKEKFEYAIHSRSICGACGQNIEKGTIRIGLPMSGLDYVCYRWNHERCIPAGMLSYDSAAGLEFLDDKDRYRIEKLLN